MDRFEVIRELGHGGIASVYLCRDKSSDARVAIKRIPVHRVQSAEQQRRVAAERYVLEHARHPFLCRGLSSFEDDEFVSLVMEPIEDPRPLYQCIWRYRTTNAFPEHVAKYFAVQLVLAIEALHGTGYIHRDLKSGNVLIDGRGVARVIDFGFAKRVGENKETQEDVERTYSICGTHYIMAPEVYLRQPYGYEVDWWGLGVIVHEMICGRPPWEYKPRDGLSPVAFFDSISAVAKGCSMGTTPSLLTETNASEECRTFARDLLVFNPKKRLGHAGGAQQVKDHPWFADVDWVAATDAQSLQSSPYNPAADFRADTLPPPSALVVSSSSAESIDPEDNANLFGDF